MKSILSLIPFLLQIDLCASFAPTKLNCFHKIGILNSHHLNKNEDDMQQSHSTDILSSRRDTLSFFLAQTVALINLKPNPSHASSNNPLGTLDRPIVILGANGRTGMAIAETLISPPTSLHTVTMTRSGKDPFQIIKLPSTNKIYLRHHPYPVDVRDPSTLEAALRSVNPSGIIYAASASKAGGNAREVDELGVGNAATVAKMLSSRFVLISALAVDRPDSKSFQITNTMGGYVDKIMDRKREGEELVRRTLKNYVIVRPGVLLSGKTKNGALDVELNQGDTIGGGLSRDELAGVAMGALLCGKEGITVEAYRKSTRTKLQPEFVVPSGNELMGESYTGLFDNAKNDA